MKKITAIIFTLAILGVFIYAFRGSFLNIWAYIENTYFPCRKPIVYTIGSFDNRFDILTNDFLKFIKEAEKIWEDPAQKDLFTYEPGGALKINLVYDTRQEATVVLQKLGVAVSNDQASFDSLKKTYDASQITYLRDKAEFEVQVATLKNYRDTYNAKVAYWDTQGGAPKKEYTDLEKEKALLNKEIASVSKLQTNLNAKVDEINALAVVLNRLALSLNIKVARFNEIGRKNQGEFEEGTYQEDTNGNVITIYQFDDAKKLVRVLAHEFGHSLGLEHVDNPVAIMYRLNNGVNEKLTQDDLIALRNLCKIE